MSFSLRWMMLSLLVAAVFTRAAGQTAITWVGPEWGDIATGANWSTGVAPTNNLTTHYMLLTGNTNVNHVAVNQSRSIAGIQFSTTATSGAVSYTPGATLTLGAYGIQNLANSNYFMEMDVPLALGANSTFTNNGQLWMTGPVNLGARVLTLSGTGDFTRLTGVISGTGSITKTGTGSWLLTNANTYSGGTTVTAGILYGSATGVFGTGPITLNGGTLGATAGMTVAGAVALNANSGLLITDTTQQLRFTGDVTMNASRSLNIGSGTVVFDGALKGTGFAFTKTGPGSLVLNAASTYTGVTTVSDGTLALGTAGTISNANLVLSNGGILATKGTFNRTYGTGAGQFQFGTNGGGFAAYGGPLTLSLFNDNPTWLSIGFYSGGFYSGGQFLYLNSPIANNVLTWNDNFSLGTDATDHYLVIADNPNSTADRVVMGGIISGGISGHLNKDGAGRLELRGANTYAGETRILGGTLRAVNAGAMGTGRVTLQFSTLELSGDTAQSFVNALSVNSGTAYLISDRETVGEGIVHTMGNATLSGTTVIRRGGNVSTGIAGIGLGTVSGSGTFNVETGASLELAAFSGNALTLTGAGNTTVHGAFNNGTSALTKTGTGTLTLEASSTRTGSTMLNSGTIALAADHALGTGLMSVSSGTIQAIGGPRTLANAITATGMLTVSGSEDIEFTGAFTNAGSANSVTVTNTGVTTFNNLNLSNSATSRTFTISNSGGVYIDGVIANGGTATSGILAKTGTGTLTLNGANTYTGETAVYGGLVAFSDPTNFGTGSITLNGGGLRWNGNADISSRLNAIGSNGAKFDTNERLVSFSTPLTGLGGVTKLGAGTLTLSGANTYSGDTFVMEGTLHVAGYISSATTFVDASASLAGALSLNNLVLNGSFVPGDGIGVATLHDLAMSSSAVLEMEIADMSSTSGHDYLSLSGNFGAAGTLNVSFVNSFTPTAPASIQLMNFATASGSFANINLPTLSGGLMWDTTNLLTNGQLNITPVPEPSTWALIALGLVAVTIARRRRR